MNDRLISIWWAIHLLSHTTNGYQIPGLRIWIPMGRRASWRTTVATFRRSSTQYPQSKILWTQWSRDRLLLARLLDPAAYRLSPEPPQENTRRRRHRCLCTEYSPTKLYTTRSPT